MRINVDLLYKLKSILNKARIYYFLIFLTVILLGITSRKISFIPLWLGDFLYAVMIYFLMRTIFIYQKSIQIAVIALLVCYCIEFLQLYQAEWIVALRKTLFGRYVLGQGFLWSDIVAYTFGIAFAFFIEKLTFKSFNQKSV